MKPKQNHNNPPACIIELDEEMASFVEENCSKNILTGLQMLSTLGTSDREMVVAEKLVAINEKFKKLKKLVDEGRVK